MTQPPSSLEQLAKDLGIGPNQLANLKKDDAYKDEAALIKTMQKWWRETRDEPRLLGKTGGIVHSSAGALRVLQLQADGRPEDAGEAVDELTQRRFTAEARQRDQAAMGELLSAMEDVREALDERVKANPKAAKVIGKELWQLRGRIDAAKARLKRRMAA